MRNLPYTRAEIKERAKAEWFGACNVTTPSFSADLTKLNGKGIRHDIELAARLGFWGTLIASECGTTPDEYIEFMEIAADFAPEGFKLVAHLSFDTLEQVLKVADAARALGLEAGLLAYPQDLVPTSSAEIVDWTTLVAEKTDLALILFAVMTWGYRALDPRGFPHDALEQMARLDTVAAIKYEASPPGILAGLADVLRRCGEHALVQCPMESTAPALIDWYGVRWIGTSGYESFGDRVPRFFEKLHKGQWNEGMDLFYSFQPAREAKGAWSATWAGANLIHRNGWKYLAWLQGFNGGLLRTPQMRLHPSQMAQLRRGLEASGYDLPADDRGFYAGRHSI
jgi:dihydrodipicolinate synthase/N-acetylneuraminate lyase